MIRLIAARGQHDDRHIARAADALQHLEAVEARQHDIEDDSVPRLGHRHFHARRAGVRDRNCVAERREVVSDQDAECAVVVNDEDARSGGGLDGGWRRHGR